MPCATASASAAPPASERDDEALEHRRDPRRAARVVETADDELALEPGRERLVGLAELRQRPFDDIHRVHPPEQRRVRLGHLERDLGALPRIGGQPQRLLQVHARRLAPGARLRASRLAQDVDPLRGRRRLGQRAAQQVGRRLRRAALHRRARGLPQARQHPAIARRPHTDEMRGDLPRGRPVGVQQAGGGAMRRVALVAAQRRLERIADDRMDEARRIVGGQHLETNEAGSQARGLGHLHPGDRRRVAQLAAVPEHGQRLREAERVRIEAAHARDHPPRDPLDARRPAARLDRARPAAAPRARPPAAVRSGTADCRRSPSRPPRTAHRSPCRRSRPHDRLDGVHAQQRRGARPSPPSARNASSDTLVNAGSCGRSATSSDRSSPSSRGAR